MSNSDFYIKNDILNVLSGNVNPYYDYSVRKQYRGRDNGQF